jgi:hypothetical protein
LSEEDAPSLMAQLGYVPGNAIKVAARQSNIPALKEYFSKMQQTNNDNSNSKDKDKRICLWFFNSIL